MSGSILLTGATGFVGSHLLRALSTSGREVVILCRSFSDTGRIAELLDGVGRINLDTTELGAALADITLAGVVHVATEYGRAGGSPAGVFRSNLLFPVDLLDHAISRGARFFVNTDSFFCKPGFACPYLRDYTYSKACFLGWARKHSSRLHVANIRLEHVYGPDDGPGKFVSAMLQRMLDPSIAEIELTAGGQKRDFVFISDVVDAYLRVIAAVDQAGPGYSAFEVGVGTSVPVRHFMELLHEATGSAAELLFGAIPYRAGEIMDSSANLTTIREIGYQPAISLEDGIQNLVAAARRHKTKEN